MTRAAKEELGGKGVRKWLERHGGGCLNRGPSAPARHANITAALPARTWRDAGDDERPAALSWEAAGKAKDLRADVVFDCRGLRPNTEAFTRKVKASALGAASAGADGMAVVDERFRLSEKVDSSDLNPGGMAVQNPIVRHGEAARVGSRRGGRRRRGKAEDTRARRRRWPGSDLRTAGESTVVRRGGKGSRSGPRRTPAEGEYAALDILRHVDGTPPPYVPAEARAISWARTVSWWGTWVALRGFLRP